MSEKLSNNYDVIIVGSGIAGSLAGALLTSLEYKKVLILERSSKISGRTISFRGDEITDANAFQTVLGLSANAWVDERTEPELSEIIKRKLLHGYVLEVGGRASWYTNRGRVSYALAIFNMPTIFYPNVGFVWFDHKWKPHNVIRGSKYGWMSEKGYSEMKRVSKRMLEISTIAEAEKYDQVHLTDWLKEITSDKEALEFHYGMGTFHTILNDPALVSAGENLKVIVQSKEADVHVVRGAWGFAGDPGHSFIVDCFADVVKHCGGQIVTNAKVMEISIQNGRAIGVVAEIGGEIKEIKSPVVICTAPPKQTLRLLPEGVLPNDFQELLGRTINAGMITGQFGMTKPLEDFCTIEVDPRSFYHAPLLIPETEGIFRGNVPLDGFTWSNIAPTVAPSGKHLAVMCSSVLEEEARDKKKVEIVINRMMNALDTAFPGWRNALEWTLFTVAGSALCWRHPEDIKPDVICPSIEGLYFAGDAFGKRCNEGGIDAAAHSGMVCAGAVTGKSYLDLLPTHLR